MGREREGAIFPRNGPLADRRGGRRSRAVTTVTPDRKMPETIARPCSPTPVVETNPRQELIALNSSRAGSGRSGRERPLAGAGAHPEEFRTWCSSTGCARRAAMSSPPARGTRARRGLPIHHAHGARRREDKLRGPRPRQTTTSQALLGLTSCRARPQAGLRRRAPRITTRDRVPRPSSSTGLAPLHGQGQGVAMGHDRVPLLHFFMTHPEPSLPHAAPRPGLGDHVFHRGGTVECTSAPAAALEKSGHPRSSCESAAAAIIARGA